MTDETTDQTTVEYWIWSTAFEADEQYYEDMMRELDEKYDDVEFVRIDGQPGRNSGQADLVLGYNPGGASATTSTREHVPVIRYDVCPDNPDMGAVVPVYGQPVTVTVASGGGRDTYGMTLRERDGDFRLFYSDDWVGDGAAELDAYVQDIGGWELIA